MLLYLIRHAHAVDGSDDAARELSRKGRDQAKAMAGFLRQRGLFAPTELWHSPLVRARETAELMVEHARLDARLFETSGLLPEDNPSRIALRLERSDLESVALVGHEPYMSALATLLVTGDPQPPRFAFRKCAVLALEGMAQHWSVQWFVTPDVVGD
jgi:phosphohistidine phosphatase